MTVEELYNKLGELIENGDGDAMIDIDDNCGGSYSLSKKRTLTIYNDELGKWCTF